MPVPPVHAISPAGRYPAAISASIAARSAEERVHQLAYVDSLTGRPNRTKFNEHMETLLAETVRSNKQFALLFLDINDFKLVNDT